MAKREVTLGTTFDGSFVIFSDGTANGTLRCDVDTLNPAMRERAMMAGIAHTIRDAGALPRDPTTGASPSIAAKVAAMRERWECIVGGEWERQRAAQTPEERFATMRAEVFSAWATLRGAAKKPNDESAFKEFLSGGKLPDGTRANLPESATVPSLARNPKIAAEVARQRAAKVSAQVTFSDI